MKYGILRGFLCFWFLGLLRVLVDAHLLHQFYKGLPGVMLLVDPSGFLPWQQVALGVWKGSLNCLCSLRASITFRPLWPHNVLHVNSRVHSLLGIPQSPQQSFPVRDAELLSVVVLAARCVVKLPSCREAERHPASLPVSPELSQVLSFSFPSRPAISCRCSSYSRAGLAEPMGSL